METIRFLCECGLNFESHPNAIGQPFYCPDCGRILVVPDNKKQAQRIPSYLPEIVPWCPTPIYETEIDFSVVANTPIGKW